MNYIEDITLVETYNNKCDVNFITFRESIVKPCNELYINGYLDKREFALFGNVVGNIRFSEYRNDEDVWQHLVRLREFYDVGFYQATYNTEKQVFYFNFKEENRAIVRVFPLEDYRKIDPNMEMKEYDFGVLYIKEDNGTILKNEDAVFKYIPEETNCIYEKDNPRNYTKVKPASFLGLQDFEE